MKFGCKKSKLDGSEVKLTSPKAMKLPESFTYQTQLSPITDQGNTNTCVCHSVAAWINWNMDIRKKTPKKDYNVNISQIYSAREDKRNDDGMTIKDALNFFKLKGVSTNAGVVKGSQFAMIGSELIAKQCIVSNGPILVALPAYNDSKYDRFWNGSDLAGGHCVVLVGYDKNGFILRNSWGTSYGRQGYSHLPYSDFNKIYEMWTIIG